MNPDKSSHGGDLHNSGNDVRSQQAAAADVLRSQIDSLYNGPASSATPVATPQPAPVASDTNPYHRTHDPHPKPHAEQWKEYHSAWQTYYQKYYENFYTAQSSKVVKEQASTEPKKHEGYFTHQPVEPDADSPEALSNDQALAELRSKLLGKVQHSAAHIRKSRHFVPILSALAVVLLFVFVQYNQVFIANVKAYVSPGSIDPQNIVVDPTADIVVSSEPRLIIPKINVDVPVTYDVGTDNASQMAAMVNGLAHFPVAGASSHPGEIGNTVLAGHSSNDLFEVGDYKFIFAQLEKLTVGDSIYANYEGKRYTYVVTKMEVVKPSEVNKLVYPTDRPVITLITCTPLGTALNRLLVTAEQVSPDPTAATAAPAGSGQQTETAAIPGDNGTLFEKLFGR